jgi:glycerophosphoryl diester phosphodiesterase
MQLSIEMKHRFLCGSIAVGLLAVTLCGPAAPVQAQTAPVIKPFLTLNGQAPLVIGHRGLPGLMPEETFPSYDMASAMGTDAFEEDLHLTKDCILVARHNPWLSDNTNIAEGA